MEFPFVALSKNRTNPIIYESADKTQKVVISGHRGHFVASIYDWDIILVVAGKIQEILNKGSEIPSCTITISRHELLLINKGLQSSTAYFGGVLGRTPKWNGT